MPVTAIDLFCGAGGLTHGFIRAGLPVTLGIDVDKHCQYPYEANNRGAVFLSKDITKVSAEDLLPYYPDGHIKVLAGCAPCQPFSTYSLGKSTTEDARWNMLGEFSRLVEEVGPEVVTMENVERMAEYNIFEEFVEDLERLGYSVSYQLVNCSDYGIPQSRRRLVLLASLFGDINLRAPDGRKDKKLTLRRAIEGLPPIAAGQAHPDDPLHFSSRLSPLNLQRIRASRPGGTWKEWDKSLRATCHTKKSGGTFPSVYGRLAWTDVGPTMTTQFYGFGNGRFGHPVQDRALSLREGALLQTFPKDYKFVEKNKRVLFKTIGRMIGNAVPVRLGKVIAESILAHLEVHQVT